MSKHKRSSQVELLRLIGCIIVLATHCNQAVNVINEPDSLHAFRYCLLSDGVAFFWMITGYFLFASSDFVKKWKGVITKIVFPAFLIYILGYVTQNFFYESEDVGFWDNISLQGFFEFISPLASAQSPSLPVTQHLWYVIAYVLVMLFLPLVKIIVDWLDKSLVLQIVFIVITLTLWIINDITYNNLLELEFSGLKVVAAAYVLIIWGHIIYKHKKVFENKIFALITGVLVIAGVAFRTWYYMYSDSMGVENAFYCCWWTSAFSLVLVALSSIFVFSVKRDGDSKADKFICFLAGFSYGMYLLHPFVVSLLDKMEYFKYITGVWGDNPTLTTIMSLIVTFVIVFAATFVINWLIRQIKKLIVAIPRKLKKA